MQALLKFGAIIVAIGFVMTALYANEVTSPDPGVIGADIGSGIGLVFGQLIGWIGVACVASSLIGISIRQVSRNRDQ